MRKSESLRKQLHHLLPSLRGSGRSVISACLTHESMAPLQSENPVGWSFSVQPVGPVERLLDGDAVGGGNQRILVAEDAEKRAFSLGDQLQGWRSTSGLS